MGRGTSVGDVIELKGVYEAQIDPTNTPTNTAGPLLRRNWHDLA